MEARMLGYGVIGNTEVFGTSILGSSPSTPATMSCLQFITLEILLMEYMFNDFYDADYTGSDYPMIIRWHNPDNDESRVRILRSKMDSDEFFDWFLAKYPEIEYTVE